MHRVSIYDHNSQKHLKTKISKYQTEYNFTLIDAEVQSKIPSKCAGELHHLTILYILNTFANRKLEFIGF